MENYKKQLAKTLAEIGSLFFGNGLILKDGRPTPYFVNFGMFRTGKLSMKLGSYFAQMMVDHGLVEKTDIILGPSYKGSAIALATSIALDINHGHDLFFEYDRKEAKTHGEGSKSSSIMVNGTIFDGCRIFIVDDVATSMGTKHEILERIKQETDTAGIKVSISGIGIAIDREQSTAVYDHEGKVIPGQKGNNAIQDFVAKTDIPVYSVAGIKEVVEYLYSEKVPVKIDGEPKAIDKETKSRFDEYLKIYGN